jgi:hypothetical protein
MPDIWIKDERASESNYFIDYFLAVVVLNTKCGKMMGVAYFGQ